MNAIPCPLCGYDAPGEACTHCDLTATAPSLSARRAGVARGVADGLAALPQGLLLLVRTRGVKRFLIPPIVLTAIVFVVFFAWLLGLFETLLVGPHLEDPSLLDMDDGWMRAVVVWLIEKGVLATLARWFASILAISSFLIAAFYTFSVAYEAIAGPFLDEIQGRLEERWFGANPRNAIQRPTDIPVARCVKLSLLAGVPALVLLCVWWWAAGLAAWLLFFTLPLPYVVAGRLVPEYGLWLGWVARVEGHTLWVSIKASCLALLILVLFFWLKFFGLPGLLLFGMIAGFSTAITLLDIPFSRREWALSLRLRFMLRNLPAMTAYGAVASLLFLVPVIGQVVVVPAASIGGLWLICRIEKGNMRPTTAPVVRRAQA